jgi:uncharacterized protein RhaS with RHS repeats
MGLTRESGPQETTGWIQQTDALSNVLRSRSYSYSMVGMITNANAVSESGERAAYTLDSLDRLTGEKHVGSAGQAISEETYTYDLAGNRTKKTVLDTTGNPLITVNYALSTGNRLGSWSVVETNLAGQVDVAGVSSEPIGTNDRFGWLYVSNAATSVKPLVNGTNWHAYDGAQVVADLNATGGLIRAYTYGPGIDNLLAITTYGGTASVPSVYYALKDHLGSVLALTDTNGVIVESYRYDAWGRPTVFDASGNILAESAVGNRFLWQGREYSWKTGLPSHRGFAATTTCPSHRGFAATTTCYYDTSPIYRPSFWPWTDDLWLKSTL